MIRHTLKLLSDAVMEFTGLIIKMLHAIVLPSGSAFIMPTSEEKLSTKYL